MDRMGQLQVLLKQSPDDSFLRHAIALELEKKGEDLMAISAFEALLADNPDYIGSYYQLGRLLEKNADPEGAIRCYEQGMEYARKAGEKRAYNELQSALDELNFE